MTHCRVSLNEILRLSKRVFLALGAGPGCEHEPALGVVWLESRGLPGLEMLWQDRLAPNHGVPARSVERREAGRPSLHIDGDGASGAWVAAAAADWLAASGPQATVAVEAVRSPLWFVPALAARGGDRPVWMLARAPGGEPLLFAHWHGGGTTLQPGWDREFRAGQEAIVTLGHGTAPRHGDLPGPRLGPGDFDARHAARLAAGIQVDEARWLALYDVARGAFVPESEQSRIRGAGAQGESQGE